MRGYLLRRIGSLLLTIGIVSIIIFFLCQIVPVDPARMALGRHATEQAVQNLREEMGLNRPVWVRYVDWIRGIVLHGDFGTSISFHRPVNSLLPRRLRRSVILAGIGFCLTVPIGLGLGVIAGLFHDTILDRLLSVIASFIVSLPVFIKAVFLILIFSIWLKWLPSIGHLSKGINMFTLNNLRRLALPIASLAIGEVGYLIRVTRVSTIETLNSDYVRTAVLKGTPKIGLVWRHVLRNALIGPITLVILHINWFISGALVVEIIFNYPGIGKLAYTAAMSNDVILVQGVTLIFVTVAVFTQVLGDVVLYLMNPRIRFD